MPQNFKNLAKYLHHGGFPHIIQKLDDQYKYMDFKDRAIIVVP